MTKSRQLWAITIAVVLAVVVSGWFLLVAPKRAQTVKLQAQTIQETSQAADLRVQVTQLAAQAKNLPAEEATLAKISQQLPDNPALPKLIRSLTTLTEATGTHLASLKPSPPVAATAAAASAPVAGAAAPAGPGLQSIPVAIEVNGTYFELVQLVSDLEQLPRVFMLDSFKIAEAKAAIDPKQLTLTVTARVFTAPSSPIAPVR